MASTPTNTFEEQASAVLGKSMHIETRTLPDLSLMVLEI